MLSSDCLFIRPVSSTCEVTIANILEYELCRIACGMTRALELQHGTRMLSIDAGISASLTYNLGPPGSSFAFGDQKRSGQVVCTWQGLRDVSGNMNERSVPQYKSEMQAVWDLIEERYNAQEIFGPQVAQTLLCHSARVAS